MRKNRNRGSRLAVDPAGAPLRDGALVVAQCLFRREESATFVTQKLADLPVLRDLVPQAVVLAREALRAAQRAGERRARLRLVGLHVHLERVLAGEPPLAPDDDAGKAPALRLGVDRLSAGGRGFPGGRHLHVDRVEARAGGGGGVRHGGAGRLGVHGLPCRRRRGEWRPRNGVRKIKIEGVGIGKFVHIGLR